VPGEWELDHVVALVNGGDESEENRRPICKPCHRKKTIVDMGGRVIGEDGYPIDLQRPGSQRTETVQAENMHQNGARTEKHVKVMSEKNRGRTGWGGEKNSQVLGGTPSAPGKKLRSQNRKPGFPACQAQARNPQP
jgi:hypothetical protein